MEAAGSKHHSAAVKTLQMQLYVPLLSWDPAQLLHSPLSAELQNKIC